MDVVPINGIRATGQERQSALIAMDYQRQVAARASQVDLGREASRLGTNADGAGSERRAFDFAYQGGPGRLVMKAGPRPGTVHVSIRVAAPLAERPDEHGPRLALEADVTSQWMLSVTRGASSQNEQAIRVAEALREAVNGAEGRALNVDVPVIRGPVHPEWPVVWLPAEYPPPPDDPALVAQLADERGGQRGRG